MKLMCRLFGHKWIHHIISFKCGYCEVEVFCKRCHIPQPVEMTGKKNKNK